MTEKVLAIAAAVALSMGAIPVCLAQPAGVGRGFDFEMVLSSAQKAVSLQGAEKMAFSVVFSSFAAASSGKEFRMDQFSVSHPERALRVLDVSVGSGEGLEAYIMRAGILQQFCLKREKDKKSGRDFCGDGLKDLERIIEICATEKPKNGGGLIIDAYFRQGRVYSSLGVLGKSLEAYSRGLALDGSGSYPEILIERAGILFGQGKYAAARDDMNAFFSASGISAPMKKLLTFGLCSKLRTKGFVVKGCPPKSVLESKNPKPYLESLMKEHERAVSGEKAGPR